MDSRGCLVSDTRDIDTITGTMMSTIYDPVSYNGGYHGAVMERMMVCCML